MNLKSLKMSVEELTNSLSPELIRIRRHLHQKPELGHQETETTMHVAQLLQSLNLIVTTEKGTTGLWADMELRASEPFLAIRSDMDALPLMEQNDIPYISQNKGIMHACGHDVHMTILMGTAMVLNHLRQEIQANVRFIFQPAEELTPGGAIDMIQRGVLNNVSAILALHVYPQIPVGNIGIKFGPYLAANDIFKIKIIGRGGHAASPHLAINPIFIAAQLISLLNQLVNQNADSATPTVLTVTKIHAGTAANIIPNEVEIWGTIRTLDETIRSLLHNRLDQTIASLYQLHGANYSLSIDRGAPPLVNNSRMSRLIYEAATDMVGVDQIIELPLPEMGSEDFAWYLQNVPGAMFRLGTCGGPGTDFDVHHPNFNIDERAIAVGVKVLCWAVIKYFSRNLHH